MKKSTQQFQTRQILRSETFEIFHYHDTKPTSVGVHHHDFYEVYLLLNGKVSYRVDGKTYKLKQGDLLLINPKEMHQPHVDEGDHYERIVLWINRSYLDSLSSDATRLVECFEKKSDNLIRPGASTGARLRQFMTKLTEEYYGSGMGKDLYSIGLFYQIMVEINRLARREDRYMEQEKPDLVTDIVAYINENYGNVITLDILAKEFFVSKYYLSHEFTRQYGTSVYKYIILKRLLMAKEQMAQGSSPGEVYSLCGFGDYTTFFRAFKSEYGISPKDFYTGIQRA